MFVDVVDAPAEVFGAGVYLKSGLGEGRIVVKGRKGRAYDASGTSLPSARPPWTRVKDSFSSSRDGFRYLHG